MINGFYSMWTKPSKVRLGTNKKYIYEMEDFEVITMILSVAAYERYNGPTKMYADEDACAYLDKTGLASMFHRGVELIGVSEEIDPLVFWAAGKLVALSKEQGASAMIDLDLIIWKDLAKCIGENPVYVIHREELNPVIYPDPHVFECNEGYSMPEEWDFSVLPANTALLYTSSEEFRKYYTSAALAFMKGCAPSKDNLNRMVFAEQRLLPICAKAMGLGVGSYVKSVSELREQTVFTHIWGHKDVLKYNLQEREQYIRRCLKRLKYDFPDYYVYAAGVKELQRYV